MFLGVPYFDTYPHLLVWGGLAELHGFMHHTDVHHATEGAKCTPSKDVPGSSL